MAFKTKLYEIYRNFSQAFSGNKETSGLDAFCEKAKAEARKVKVWKESGVEGDSAEQWDAMLWNTGALNGMMPREMAAYFVEGFIGWQACSMLSQHWLIDKACSMPANDAITPGFRVLSDKKKTASEIENKLKKLSIEEVLVKAIRTSRVYGQALIVPTFDKKVDMEVPFNPDGLKGKKLESLQVVNPMYYSPVFDEDSMADSKSPIFYQPTWYNFAGGSASRVHKSWVFKVIEPMAPDMLWPMYYYGGVPITQKIYRSVYSAERVAKEIPLLVETKRLLVADSFSSDMVLNPDGVREAAAGIAQMRDNFGVLLKDPESKIAQIDTNLSELDRVLMAQFRVVAAVAEIPVNKLMRYQESGTATSTKEDGDYRQVLKRITKFQAVPAMELVLKLMGKEEEEIEFNEYDFSSAEEKATTFEKDTISLMHAASVGALTKDDYRKVLKSNYSQKFSEIEDELPEEELPDGRMEMLGLEAKKAFAANPAAPNPDAPENQGSPSAKTQKLSNTAK